MSKSGCFFRDGGVGFASSLGHRGGDGGLEAGGWLFFFFFWLSVRIFILAFSQRLSAQSLRLAYHSSARM